MYGCFRIFRGAALALLRQGSSGLILRIRIVLLLLWCLTARPGYAQESRDKLEERLAEGDIRRRLPPLDSLIAWAQVHSPQTQFFEAEETYGTLKEKEARGNWLQALSLNGSYSYGIFDNLNNQQLAGDPNASQLLISTTQTRFNVSAAVSIPFDLIFGRKREIRIAQADLEKTRASRKASENELRDLVIVKYFDLVLAYENFVIANTMLESQRIAAQRAHVDFRNGAIDYDSYSSTQQGFQDGIQKKNSRRIELMLAIKNLENLVGIKLDLSDEI